MSSSPTVMWLIRARCSGGILRRSTTLSGMNSPEGLSCSLVTGLSCRLVVTALRLKPPQNGFRHTVTGRAPRWLLQEFWTLHHLPYGTGGGGGGDGGGPSGLTLTCTAAAWLAIAPIAPAGVRCSDPGNRRQAMRSRSGNADAQGTPRRTTQSDGVAATAIGGILMGALHR
jgi:hypothetical protein